MNFSELGLSPEVLKAIEEAGYTEPTPIQEKAIPYVLMSRDVLGCAQTGTGKTASFTVPMIEILATTRTRARMPRSLIIAPTRELAAQVAESFEKYAKYHNFKLALLIGGTSMEEQEKKLDRGVQVLIATPGRLIDLFERGKVLLADVKILVIDEADRMLDMGFMPDVERIVKLLPKMRQTLFFSATMPPEIRRLAGQFLMNPKEISVSPPTSPAETVSQGLVRVKGGAKEKREALRHLMQRENIASALVFCNRKRDVDIVYKSLKKHGFSTEALHGDMVQSVRTETLGSFKNGEVQYLVCSDVAARGLDILAVSHVFNFDVPINPEDYIHRIGRTGRAGRTGSSFVLALPEEYKSLQAIQRMIGKDIPDVQLDDVEGWDDSEAEAGSRGRRKSGRSDGRKTRTSERGATKPKAPPAPPAPPQKPEADDKRSYVEPVRAGGSPRTSSRSDWFDDNAPTAKSFGDHMPAFMRKSVG
jgi:superfamily II DNA/RNA helicase